MSKMQIGTLLRCAHMEERRLALTRSDATATTFTLNFR